MILYELPYVEAVDYMQMIGEREERRRGFDAALHGAELKGGAAARATGRTSLRAFHESRRR